MAFGDDPHGSKGFGPDPNAPRFGELPDPQARKGSSAGKILLILGLVGGLGLLVCCGGLVAVIGFGMNMIGDEVAAAVQDDPVIQQHIGDIQSISVNYIRTGEEEGEDVMVFNLKGSKGDGVLIAETVTVDSGDEEVRWAKLELPGGEKVDLQIGPVPPR